ncbi:MAG TPA: NUDIX domain-containing protein [Candidatus Binatia bacterium]|jgi:8-oxo-dGTP pyrophosphatase MutT (NUDIX family)|nr:NUDIX domain-containing protein [Candidatus Binatia bacterium]
MDRLVTCKKLFGGTIDVPAGELGFRPGAYALVLRERKLLMIRIRATGEWFLPGGGVEPGEPVEEALIREVQEETGIDVTVRSFFGFKENFFYYDPAARAFHGLCFFYVCEPVSQEPLPTLEGHDPEEGDPAWIEIGSLRDDEYHGLAGEVVREYLGSLGG